jgi:F0F1-type ATP synthase membrane subunit b/b'
MRFSTILMLCLVVLAAFVSADHVDEAKQRASNALNEAREAGKQTYEAGKDKVNEAGERIRKLI